MESGYKVLITGGCGYIGSHTAIDLLNKGFEVISIDNFSRSRSDVPDRIKQITGKPFHNYRVDCRDLNKLRAIFEEQGNIRGIIHFAAFKSVGESVEKPLIYYDNNINSLINMLRICDEFSVQDFVFSSSCSVYGNAQSLPVDELTELMPPESPYGWTKLFSEQMIKDHAAMTPGVKFVLLRYFNPVGAHESGMIGEIPWGTPSNIVPSITRTAIGKQEKFYIFGDDYPTQDGTCVRDYIHVMDIADAHTKALQLLMENRNASNCEIFNLGTGTGVSVMQLVNAFKEVNGVPLNCEIAGKRAGDVIAVYADNKKARQTLGWYCSRSIHDMMQSAWLWEKQMQKENL